MKGWYRAALLGIGTIACQYVAATPTIEHWTTANGARVYFVEAPEIPIVDLRVVFAAGSARDGRIKGIANLTNALLKEGAGDLDVDAFSKKFSATGAKLSVAVARDMAYATVKTLSEPKYAEPALALFEQVLGSPRFDAASIERLKARMLVALKRKQQSPGTIAQDTFFEQVYADHPYASSPDGSEASVAAITRADILAHYDKYYVAQNAIVAIVGALGVDEAKALADDVTAGLDAGERAAALPDVVSPQSAQLEHIEFPSIQSHVRVGLPACGAAIQTISRCWSEITLLVATAWCRYSSAKSARSAACPTARTATSYRWPNEARSSLHCKQIVVSRMRPYKC